MQFLVSVIDSETGTATAAEMAAIDAFNERMRLEDRWVLAGGLTHPGSASVVDNRDGRGLVTDGPFVESKEYLAGVWILKARDLDDALTVARDASQACNRRVEVRPFL